MTKEILQLSHFKKGLTTQHAHKDYFGYLVAYTKDEILAEFSEKVTKSAVRYANSVSASPVLDAIYTALCTHNPDMPYADRAQDLQQTAALAIWDAFLQSYTTDEAFKLASHAVYNAIYAEIRRPSTKHVYLGTYKVDDEGNEIEADIEDITQRIDDIVSDRVYATDFIAALVSVLRPSEIAILRKLAKGYSFSEIASLSGHTKSAVSQTWKHIRQKAAALRVQYDAEQKIR